MIGFINLNFLKLNLSRLNLRSRGAAQTRSSLLGITLDAHRLETVLVRRSNGSLRLQQSAATPLELNLLTDDPELVGREIRNHLDRAEIRERYCAVCLPLEWAMTAHVAIPELPAEDVDSFLNLEAERAFPLPQESLSLLTSRCQGSAGAQFATLIAIPKDHLTTLQKVLKAAQLKPVSFSLRMPALLDPAGTVAEGMAALGVGESSVELQVCCGGGIAALRGLEGALEQDGAGKKPYVDVVARDLRITLGQLPAELRQAVHRLKVFGQGATLGRFTEDLAARAKLMGLEVELVSHYAPAEFESNPPPHTPISPGVSLAVRVLLGRGAALEFLPPRVSTWQQMTGRYSSKKLALAGAVGGIIALLLLGALLTQQWQLRRWRGEWTRIKARVSELDGMQQRIRQFRPWFDDSFRSLSILRQITAAFPEDGSVFAKTVEIRDPGTVSCSGTSRDQQALLRVVDQLRASKKFNSVQVDQIRGKQFTINLHWGGGGNP